MIVRGVGISRKMFRAKDWGRKSSTWLTIIRWERDLVIRGYRTGMKLWGVRWLGVLSVIVGVLLGIIVRHVLC